MVGGEQSGRQGDARPCPRRPLTVDGDRELRERGWGGACPQVILELRPLCLPSRLPVRPLTPCPLSAVLKRFAARARCERYGERDEGQAEGWGLGVAERSGGGGRGKQRDRDKGEGSGG